MLRLRTVSYSGVEKALTDEAEFRRFKALLKERYPYIKEKGTWREIGSYGLLIRIPGRGAARPSVLMAHMDVVPAEAELWQTDPFGAELKDGRIISRGALDTKCTLCSVMEALEGHLADGFVPEQDLWLSFGGEEEVSGACCGMIVDELERLGVHPDLVLDEGGSVIPEGLPGVPGMAAVVGVAEKGVATYEISLAGPGGHASVPPKSTVIGSLSRAAAAVEAFHFPARLSTPVRKMFRSLADEVPFFEKPVFAHPEAAAPFVSAAASRMGGTFNAMVRTTCAVTQIQGGSAANVLPERASFVVNARILEGDTVESVRRRLESIMSETGKKRLEPFRIRTISGSEPTETSDTDCEAFRKLVGVIRETWPGAVVAPYQMNGGTDGRFMCRLTDHVYRFSPMIMTKEERAMVHGTDESIAEETYFTMIRFYAKLIGKL